VDDNFFDRSKILIKIKQKTRNDKGKEICCLHSDKNIALDPDPYSSQNAGSGSVFI